MTDSDRQRIGTGSACILVGALMFAVSGGAVKALADTLSSETIVFWRNLFSVALLLPIALVRRKQWLQTRNMTLIGLRALTIVTSLYCYYFAVSVLPLSDAVLLISTSPIFVPLIGYLLFRFAFDARVMMAVIVGFVGVAIILQPDGTMSLIGGLSGLLAGLMGAVGAVVIWRMPADEDAGRITFFLSLFSALIFLAPAISAGQWPTMQDFHLLLLLGAASTAAHFLFSYACLIAPADRIMSLEYSTIIFASVIAWIIWDERPDLMFAAGSVLVVGASIYVLRSQKKPIPTQPHKQSRLRCIWLRQ